MARSPIERDRYSREIELVPDPEAPARFALILASLLEGLYAIGVEREHAWKLVTKVAFDSMPAQRRQVIRLLAEVETTTTKMAAHGARPADDDGPASARRPGRTPTCAARGGRRRPQRRMAPNRLDTG